MLKEISFFASMAESDLRRIAEIITVREYAKGAAIVEELTEAERFFVIYRGKIEISKKFEGFEEFILSVQSDGDFFGEMALLDEGRRSATVKALEPTTVLEISRLDFENLLYKAPVLAYRIMKELSSRLRETGALLISHLKQANRQLYRAYIDTTTIVVKAIEEKHPHIEGLDRQVTSLAKAIGREMGLAEEELLVLELGALLHDLGMLELPAELLAKRTPLSPSEAEAIRKHTRGTASMIEGVPLLGKVIPAIRSHHERYDGKGYPDGLSGAGIPLESRILALADAFIAMTHDRPYRGRMALEDAIAEVRREAGGQFDPAVVDAFLRTRAGAGAEADPIL
ncbi:MAG TPA: cyclic nucleotide-binding domain-containing protein [Spirochaetales bacterium]|nr:cyclic nucleotide-binding domain-containing protein [Spirochaetales bacterium]HRZ64889.1 cyclic nucleotide-binding domain-containing protein [Spirochaetia bacterium]